MSRAQALMWLKMNPRFEDRGGKSTAQEVMVSWNDGGQSHVHLLSWSSLREWMEEFYAKHPTWGLIVAEIVAVPGIKRT